MDPFLRSALLLSESGIKTLRRSHVIVFGVGGVGSFVVEALVRTGLGEITLVDHDDVDITNLNRQLQTTRENVGRLKVEMLKERILAINPDCKVHALPVFYDDDREDEIFATSYDYMVDAVDTVTAKLQLMQVSEKRQIPFISSMGAGNKLDPTAFRVGKLTETSMDPLARVLRRECRKRGIDGGKVKVVYSMEPPMKPLVSISSGAKKEVPGSVAFVPSVAGLIIGGEVIKDIVFKRKV